MIAGLELRDLGADRLHHPGAIGHPCATQERKTMEAYDSWCNRQERDAAQIEIPRPSHLAKVERIPPQKPRRDEGALREAAGSVPSSHTFCECVAGRGMARDFDRQVAELQIRAAVLNRYTALGIPVSEPVG